MTKRKRLDVYDDPEAWSRVPYPYQFKWDAGWIFVVVLGAISGLAVAGGNADGGAFVFLSIACFIAFLRVVIWLCFRFPMTSWFFVTFFAFLIGGRRRW